MPKRILYTRLDGGVSVVSPAPALVMEFHLFGRATGTLTWIGPAVPHETANMPLAAAEDAALVFVRAHHVPPEAMDVQVCHLADIPASRRFRNCWRRAGAALVTVDMSLARAQRMDEIRRDRVPKLTMADNAIRVAEDQGQSEHVTVLHTYRQQLRDVPQTHQAAIEACTTPEQLEAWEPIWPTSP